MSAVVPFIGPIVTGLGVIGKTVASVSAASEQARAAKIEAQSAREDAIARAEEQRQQSQRVLSRGEKITAASGLDISGSPLEILLDSARQGELEAQKTRVSGERQAFGLESESRLAKRRRTGAFFESVGGLGTILGRTIYRNTSATNPATTPTIGGP